MAEHKIEDNTDRRIDSLVITTFALCVFSWFAFQIFKNKWPQFNFHNLPRLLFCYLMIGASAFPTINLAVVLLRLRIFGIPILSLNHIPLKLGQEANGRITLNPPVREFSRIKLKISCHQLVRGSGRGGNKDITLWENSQSVDPHSVESTEQQIVIPVSFLIPANGQPSKRSSGSLLKYPSQIQWQLEIKAFHWPGLSFRPTFILPVAE